MKHLSGPLLNTRPAILVEVMSYFVAKVCALGKSRAASAATPVLGVATADFFVLSQGNNSRSGKKIEKLIRALALTTFLSSESLNAQIIPADRLPLPGTWDTTGVEGGIPNRSTIFADITKPPYNANKTGAVSASAALQHAIQDCPNGQVLYVPAGTYLISERILLRKSITIRGDGSATVLKPTKTAFLIGGLGPWPPPKNNPPYYMNVVDGTTRGSTSVTVANASSVEIGKMIMVDEMDEPSLVWAKSGFVGRCRGSMHLVESRSGNTIKFRPSLPIDYMRSPRLSRHPDIVKDAGIEDIKFVGNGTAPGLFVEIACGWNIWVKGCEFANMPSRTVMAYLSGHVELRKNYMHDQSSGGPNSEGLDFFADVNWGAIVDNICVAGGYPQINIGDAGAGNNYSGGFGNVIAYNYAVDSYYTDPPTSPDHWMMTHDISVNHSPHAQFNLVEGNYMSKFGSDGYHGSGSHAVLLRNVVTGRNRWIHAVYRTAVQIDRRNTFYSIVGNVLGQVGNPTTFEYVTNSGWSSSASTIFRLGYPDMGNQGFSGTYPPIPIKFGDGGPRDLYVDRNNTACGTTIIEGNWTSKKGARDWTITPATIPNSLYLTSKPGWFGNLKWPPVDPGQPVTDDPAIIPAGYRYVHGKDPPPDNLDKDGDALLDDWEIHYFGSTDDPRAEPGLDIDGDGFDNLAEQAAGTSPVDAADGLRITSQRVVPPESFVVQWRAASGRVYQVDYSNTLTDWSTVATMTNGSAPSQLWTDDGSLTGGAPLETEKRFYRIRVPIE
jgi:hypothetical protein